MWTALVIVHLLGATFWVGGTVSLVFVAVPPVQRLEGTERASLLREFGRRWRPIGWSSLGVAIASGAALAVHDDAFNGAAARADWVLVVKGALVGVLVAGAYLHDYVLGPGLARQIRAGEPQTLRRLLTLIGRTNLLISVTLPVLGALLAEFLDS